MKLQRRLIITLLTLTLACLTGRAQTEWTYTRLPQNFVGIEKNVLSFSAELKRIFRKVENRKPLRIMQIGDSHTKGNYLPRATGQALQDYFCPIMKADSTECIAFHWYGINGAWAKRFLEEDLVAKVAEFDPDLLIISFGTNEAHAGTIYQAELKQTLKDLVQAMRLTNPAMAFLITAPPGSFVSKTTGVYHTGKGKRARTHYVTAKHPNTNTSRVVEAYEQFCRENKIAFWNQYKVYGGDRHAAYNWAEAGLMQNDRIHYTAEGYVLQGRLLADALIKSYKNYLKKK